MKKIAGLLMIIVFVLPANKNQTMQALNNFVKINCLNGIKNLLML
jgi:hypothetical protein